MSYNAIVLTICTVFLHPFRVRAEVVVLNAHSVVHPSLIARRNYATQAIKPVIAF
jgi:hypothetical protein